MNFILIKLHTGQRGLMECAGAVVGCVCVVIGTVCWRRLTKKYFSTHDLALFSLFVDWVSLRQTCDEAVSWFGTRFRLHLRIVPMPPILQIGNFEPPAKLNFREQKFPDDARPSANKPSHKWLCDTSTRRDTFAGETRYPRSGVRCASEAENKNSSTRRAYALTIEFHC